MSVDLSAPVNASTAAAGPAFLDLALRRILVPPSVPPGLASKVMAIALNDALDLEARRLQLEAEYQTESRRLQSGYVQLRRQSLAAVIASSFATGVCASLLVPRLYDQVGTDISLTLPLVAAVIGAAAGASVWIERFGRPVRR
jgi:hypothetical protein